MFVVMVRLVAICWFMFYFSWHDRPCFVSWFCNRPKSGHKKTIIKTLKNISYVFFMFYYDFLMFLLCLVYVLRLGLCFVLCFGFGYCFVLCFGFWVMFRVMFRTNIEFDQQTLLQAESVNEQPSSVLFFGFFLNG